MVFARKILHDTQEGNAKLVSENVCVYFILLYFIFKVIFLFVFVFIFGTVFSFEVVLQDFGAPYFSDYFQPFVLFWSSSNLRSSSKIVNICHTEKYYTKIGRILPILYWCHQAVFCVDKWVVTGCRFVDFFQNWADCAFLHN